MKSSGQERSLTSDFSPLNTPYGKTTLSGSMVTWLIYELCDLQSFKASVLFFLKALVKTGGGSVFAVGMVVFYQK